MSKETHGIATDPSADPWPAVVVPVDLQVDPGRALEALDAYFREALPDDPAGMRFCREWVVASAALPVLRWQVTVAIGQALLPESPRGRIDEAWHLAVARIAWFRSGRMPEPVRAALLNGVPSSEWSRLRSAVAKVLYAALRPQFRTRRVKPGRRTMATVRLVLERAREDDAGRDPLLGLVLLGMRPKGLALHLARWRAGLGPFGWWLTAPRHLLAIVLSVLAAVGVMIVAPSYWPTFLAERPGTPVALAENSLPSSGADVARTDLSRGSDTGST